MDPQTEEAAAAPADFWERWYRATEQAWSGRVNAVLADVAARLEPGTALDLGCGEGADTVWLAGRGWTATGVDISPTAIARATEAARVARVPEDRARFVVADLATLVAGDRYDLVTASFLHSPVDLPRMEILRAASDLVAPSGHLLITSHVDPPPGAGAEASHDHGHGLLGPAEQIDALGLDRGAWDTVIAEVRVREVLREGSPATIHDAVVLLRRS
jgi:SAM-dependent methyltransferase